MSVAVEKSPRNGAYGFDAPYVPLLLSSSGALFLAFAAVSALNGSVSGTVGWLLSSASMLLASASYIYATRVGKFVVWARLLRDLHLEGGERVLDMGCGRGAVLLMAAKLLPTGRAVGLDLWKSADQSGNAIEVTTRNAEREGVADRVELHTGDMREMPFPDGAFEVVLSSLAIHNISDAAGRKRAIDEAVRVLKPAGRLVIADILRTRDYADRLRALEMTAVIERGLGWRFWYGGPWVATRLVTATKPVGRQFAEGA